MINIYHSYYKFWRNFERKQDFCWVAITKTIPVDYIGNVYRDLAPIGKNFDEAENPFNFNKFMIEYTNLLKTLNKECILADLRSFSKNNKDVVIVNWEDLTKFSEGRFAYAWLFNLTIEQADFYDLENILKINKNNDDLLGFNFLEL